MDNYFWVKWKENNIGFLIRMDNTYYARFQVKHLADKNVGDEIIKQTSFKPNILYENDELFDFFKRRLRISPDEDVFDRIKKTGAKRPTDNYWLEEMTEEERKHFEQLIKEVIERSIGEEK